MRKMATIRSIDNISPIDGADRIELAKIGGWSVVVEKGLYRPGDWIIYCEIDSWIPHSIAPYLSNGSTPKEFCGIVGNKLRSVRLRGALSQGLVLSLRLLPEDVRDTLQMHQDVSHELNILKYEPPISAQLSGLIRGTFPHHTPKTDQDRIQNLERELAEFNNTCRSFEITEKLEGASMTVSFYNGDIEVSSRNLSLQDDGKNTYWKVAKQDNLIDVLKTYNKNISLQGELIGEGVEGNIYKLKGHTFMLYDIFDIDNQRYYTASERSAFSNKFNVKHVPILGSKTFGDVSIPELLEQANGYSALNPQVLREGLVFKDVTDGHVSFKAISNEYLLS